jgi:hypothetical protein
MTKKKTFIDSPEWTSIVDNLQNLSTSDGTMATLMDYERVLDEADVYAFKNWKLGELVDGPVVKKYSVTATWMWPSDLMPDPRAGKRLSTLGCVVEFMKTKVKVPIKIQNPDDYKPGTHYPKLIDRSVWLVNITIPTQLMEDILEGSVDIADQTVDLDDLEDAYAKDYDTADVQGDKKGAPADAGGLGGIGGLPSAPPGIGGLGGPPAPPGGGLV